MPRQAAIGFLMLTAGLVPARVVAEDSLEALNSVARSGYSEARATLLARNGPVLLVSGDDAVLLRGKERTAKTFMPPIYHKLKAVSHAPLAICVLLTAYGEGPLGDEQLAQLRRLRGAIGAAHEGLDQHGFSTEQLPRQKRQLAESADFLVQVLKHERCSRDALLVFCRAQRSLIDSNIADAARAQLDALHAQVAAWRSELPAAEWARLKVVVIGSQMPRRQNATVQYFAKLLGEKGEGPRIIYAEGLFEEERALRLLGTHLLDREVGIAFFDDPQRMSRDLLSDAAAEYLKTLKLD